MVRVLHAQAVTRSGGSPELRDSALLESALDRPRNRFAYGSNPSLFELAAATCWGIIRNHPFIDGNKRAGLLAAAVFLDLNDYELQPEEVEIVHVIRGLAAGELGEADLAIWLSDNSLRKRGPGRSR